MVEIFKYMDKFFTSLTNYLTYNYIFIVFVGLFLVTILGVVIGTSRSYEARLIKAIDKLNSYFIDNPYINDENLVAFNEKMKSKVVPKQLRKHWQQYVLYRENKASTYMSFENCVSNPIRNSTYTRDVKLMSSLAWIFSMAALILNCYYCFETVDIAAALRGVLLTPIVILLLNYFVQIFLNLRHNAIVSDLFQNYQYFEVNIDKATSTLPEYVDYEVLFDKNEIKKGIPILYAYLQKRAEEEQRELERARLRNVEHEKFNFDDQGIAGSLVLERALQEAENYIAERKKYTQDIGQINADITQEDMNYREITKEYNRQMQVSKETFANFKAQLEEVSSTIEANYLKKQQQQELDRQRNLERDYDAATERHKKIIDSYQAELDTVDGFIAQSRKNLEAAMKSEFETYSSKVYDEARKVVDEREKAKYQKLTKDINVLEENLFAKAQELEKSYQENQVLTEQVENVTYEVMQLRGSKRKGSKAEREQKIEPIPQTPVAEKVEVKENPQEIAESVETPEEGKPVMSYEDYKKQFAGETKEEQPVESYEEYKNQPETETPTEEKLSFEYEPVDEENDLLNEQEETNSNDLVEEQDLSSIEKVEEISTEPTGDSIEKPVSRRGRPRKVVDGTATQGEKRKAGRPRKVVEQTESTEPKRGRGRPKKEISEVTSNEPKKGRGRPRKVVDDTATQGEKRKAGRPRKVVEETTSTEPKKGRGRPKKEVSEVVTNEPKKGRGRPKKVVSTEVATEPKQVEQNLSDIKDIDEYLKEIDNAIAEENAKMEETQKELVKNSKLKRKK